MLSLGLLLVIPVTIPWIYEYFQLKDSDTRGIFYYVGGILFLWGLVEFLPEKKKL